MPGGLCRFRPGLPRPSFAAKIVILECELMEGLPVKLSSCPALLAAFALAMGSLGAAAPAMELRVLSGRADMVTGDDALVEAGATLEKFSATLNRQDISNSFRAGKAGTLIARIEGLKKGKNH